MGSCRPLFLIWLWIFRATLPPVPPFSLPLLVLLLFPLPLRLLLLAVLFFRLPFPCVRLSLSLFLTRFRDFLLRLPRLFLPSRLLFLFLQFFPVSIFLQLPFRLPSLGLRFLPLLLLLLFLLFLTLCLLLVLAFHFLGGSSFCFSFGSGVVPALGVGISPSASSGVPPFYSFTASAPSASASALPCSVLAPTSPGFSSAPPPPASFSASPPASDLYSGSDDHLPDEDSPFVDPSGAPLPSDAFRAEYRGMIKYILGLFPQSAGSPPAAPPPPRALFENLFASASPTVPRLSFN